MAARISDHQWLYPYPSWADYADGAVWKLTRLSDYLCPSEQLRNAARTWASRNGYKVKTELFTEKSEACQTAVEHVVIQFTRDKSKPLRTAANLSDPELEEVAAEWREVAGRNVAGKPLAPPARWDWCRAAEND